MATSEISLTLVEVPQPHNKAVGSTAPRKRLDLWMLAGVLIAAATLIAGIASTGVNPAYFLQPSSALIVIGGTLGVMLITTPRAALRHCINRVIGLLRAPAHSNREHVIDELVSHARVVRTKGLLAVEGKIQQTADPFLRDLLLLALDVDQRSDLQSALENQIRLSERQGDADAKVLEVAGGFAPTLGVIGTVIGLIDVLRQFSDLSVVTYGIGAAFVSTIYGLALANLVLLPAAQRIRVRVAEEFELHEMMMEGGLCLYDAVHPALVRQRLSCYLRIPDNNRALLQAASKVKLNEA